MLAALIIALATPIALAYTDQPLRLFYNSRENLILRRLLIDPSTHRVNALANAQCTVMHDTLPPPGPEMDQLKGWVVGGMGLVVVLGEDVPGASLAALTNDAVKEVSQVEAAEGPYHAAEAESSALRSSTSARATIH